jgi:hypothetical protein
MTAANDSDNDLGALRDDLAALKRDVTGLIEHLKTGATNSAQNAADQLDDGAHRLCRNVVAESERSAKVIGREIEEHPLLALLIALGVGYISGRVLPK